MTIYSGAGDKQRDRRAVRQQTMKKEPVEVEAVNDTSQMSNTTASLLLPTNLGAQEINSIDADLMLNTLGDEPTGSENAMSVVDNGLGSQSIAQNQLFDETSQVSARKLSQLGSKFTFFQPPENLLADDLFGFDGKEDEENKTVTKYNPRHKDILRLSSVNDYSSHLENVQTDLDSLKDLLGRNDGYQLDSHQLLEVRSLVVESHLQTLQIASKMKGDRECFPRFDFGFSLLYSPFLLTFRSDECLVLAIVTNIRTQLYRFTCHRTVLIPRHSIRFVNSMLSRHQELRSMNLQLTVFLRRKLMNFH